MLDRYRRKWVRLWLKRQKPGSTPRHACYSLGKLLNLFVPQFLNLESGDDCTGIYSLEFSENKISNSFKASRIKKSELRHTEVKSLVESYTVNLQHILFQITFSYPTECIFSTTAA